MVYVYAPEIKEGTRELISTLGAKRLAHFDGLSFVSKGRPLTFELNDVIICWGYSVPPISGVRMLNSSLTFNTPISMITQLVKLSSSMIQSVYYAVTSEQANLASKPFVLGELIRGASSHKVVRLKDFPTYTSQYVELKAEYEVHIFDGKVIRFAKRVPNSAGDEAHGWYRSRKTGWELDFRAKPVAAIVNTAQAVMNKAELEFGVVHIGTHREAQDELGLGALYVVRKIETAPDLDVEGLDIYSKALINWIDKK